MTATAKTRSFTYGIAPGVYVPADFPMLVRRYDVHAVYRRPSFDTRGNRNRDAEGKPAWDTSALPCSDHFRHAEKGFEFVGPFVDCPDELRVILAATDETRAILPPPAPAAPADEVEVPPDIQELARADARGVFQKGDMESTFTLREYRNLVRKGWTYEGPAAR